MSWVRAVIAAVLGASLITGCAGALVRKSCSLSNAEATALAARLANAECGTRFGQTPFSGESFPIELRKNRWFWGSVDPAGINGFSAEVSFDKCGNDSQVTVYYSSDALKALYR